MKPGLPRDVPKGAAITIVALVLVATLVMGREDPAPSLREAAPAPTEQAGEQPGGGPPLAIERLNRPKKDGVVPDLFGSPAVAKVRTATPSAALHPAPRAPAAPPLPFTYIGRMVKDGKTILFLASGPDGLAAAEGDPVGQAYRLEALSDTSATFVYLPNGSRQTLALPAPQ